MEQEKADLQLRSKNWSSFNQNPRRKAPPNQGKGLFQLPSNAYIPAVLLPKSTHGPWPKALPQRPWCAPGRVSGDTFLWCQLICDVIMTVWLQRCSPLNTVERQSSAVWHGIRKAWPRPCRTDFSWTWRGTWRVRRNEPAGKAFPPGTWTHEACSSGAYSPATILTRVLILQSWEASHIRDSRRFSSWLTDGYGCSGNPDLRRSAWIFRVSAI